MATDLTARLIAAATAAIDAHADELTRLDQAIGDGDHGINMRRGFTAVAEITGELASLDLPAALHKIGMTLVMKIGGASGPLYGSLLMAMGKAVDHPPRGLAEVHKMLEDGIAAVKKRGRSEPGEKTMLDVLVPVSACLARALREGGDPGRLCRLLRATADQGLESTRDMRATKGRASFLGERSVGHLDPGARSSQLLVRALCDAMDRPGASDERATP